MADNEGTNPNAVTGDPVAGDLAEQVDVRAAAEAAFDAAEKETPSLDADDSLKADSAERPGDGAKDKPSPETAPGDGPTRDSSDGPQDTSAESQEAPAHWALNDRDMFAKQTPEAQTWLLDRSRAMEAAHTQRSQEVAPMREAMAAWQPYLGSLGITAPQAVNSMLGAEYKLRTGTPEQKQQMLAKMANDYGIPMGEPSEDAPQVDPNMLALQGEIRDLRAGLNNSAQAQHGARVHEATGTVQAFAEAKDAEGALAHPHFGAVEADMTRLAQADVAAGVQPNIDELYERACWSNAAVRGKLMAAQQTAAETQRLATEKERIAKAKAANGSMTGAGGTPPVEQPIRSVEQAVTAAWDAASAG